MKKIICLTLVILVMLSSCKKPTSYNLEVKNELFEQLDVVGTGQGTYKKYETEQEIFEDSDLVVVAMPVNTYTDEKIIYYDAQSNVVTKEQDWVIYKTLRPLKIIQVIKGDKNIKDVEMTQLGGVYIDNEGTKRIMGMTANSFIQKQNVKYIYYLKKDNDNYYYACPDQGVINVDGLDENAISRVTGERTAQAMLKYSELYEEFDRTEEVLAK